MIKRNIYWFDCNFLLNIYIQHTKVITSSNLALILKLIDSNFFDF